MAISRQKKEEVSAKITDIVKNSAAVVFVNFHGLSVEDINAIRRNLQEQGVHYVVVKKTLAKRVLASSDIKGEIPSLDGELAFAYSDDSIGPARNVVKCGKKYKERISPLGGIFENRYISINEIVRLAQIPSHEVLYGQFAMILNTPIQQTVIVLSAVTQSFVITLDQIAKSKS